MKHYMDIENLRAETIDLGNGMVRERNDQAFEEGDHINVTEKIDGSNASVALNPETGKLEAFSRKQALSPTSTLNGFYNYVQELDPKDFSENIIVFGEWTGARNKIVYDKAKTGKWYVFDIYDKKLGRYWKQYDVRKFCVDRKLNFVHLLYDGPFRGWNFLKEFCEKPSYGDVQEGIVVKNMKKLVDQKNKFPVYLKIVNTSFKESMVKAPKEVDPEKEAGKALAAELASQIVTENRVSKMMLKLRDEGVLSDSLTPDDMKTIAKYLPARIYEDCVKEEPEIVERMGEFGGKAISALTMRIARTLVCG